MIDRPYPPMSRATARKPSAGCRLLRRSRFKRRSGAHEHDLAKNASPLEQLLRASCLGKGKALRDERLDLSLLKEAEQGEQILPKQSRLQPFERLNAVRNDPSPAGEKPAAGDVQRVNGDSMK